jgi:phosphonate ABC transporter permease subunit PhnE
MKESLPQLSPRSSALRTFLLVIVAVVVYAYAVDAVRINLQAPTEARRQAQFTNVLRLLAQPDLFVFDADSGRIAGWSDTAKIAGERIIETIFMALMASTVGTALAIPVSFIAARNIMGQVTMPLGAFTAALIALPIGWAAGSAAASLLVGWGAQIAALGSLIGLGAAVVALVAGWGALKVGPTLVTTDKPTPTQNAISILRLLVFTALVFLSLAILAHLGLVGGRWLQQQLNANPVVFVAWFSFVGNFIYVMSDFFRVLAPGIAAFLVAGVAVSLGSRLGTEVLLDMSVTAARIFTVVASAVGIGLFVYGIGSGLNWFYQFDNPLNWTIYPAAGAALLAGIVGGVIDPKRPFAVGFAIYFVFRTFLNVTRSIESLIMAIIFVIWVGVGPFAGVLALSLHSIAALGKLFSEQVESIATGPVEAITATGANRLQTIVYAVIPQIIPPYIAFAFYRWDINVRMSTIIGFVGGGGVGFVLAQYIGQLRYQQASVMMLSIAIVVATLDYVSSRVRSRII